MPLKHLSNQLYNDEGCYFSCCLGITPMLQIIAAIVKDKGDSTHVSLLFANQVFTSRNYNGNVKPLLKIH
jgi:hypothetical protein